MVSDYFHHNKVKGGLRSPKTKCVLSIITILVVAL